jgi:hypothetical protein
MQQLAVVSICAEGSTIRLCVVGYMPRALFSMYVGYTLFCSTFCTVL